MQLSSTGRPWAEQTVRVGPVSSNLDGVPDWLSAYLDKQDGMVDGEDAFLRPSLSTLPDPGLMKDCGKACDILIEAVTSQTSIVVFGDYDVDGVGATTVLTDYLRQVGANVSFYIPDRQTEGYGLNIEAIERLASSHGILVTADCGVTSVQEITRAKELGMQVIVVDHHAVPDEPAPADACLNPHQPDCAYPFKDLCATGVAFMLVCALRRTMRERGMLAEGAEPDVRQLLDVVCLATVADMVPLRGPNRVLVTRGLQQIAATERCGLRALVQVAKLTPPISSIDVAFRLAPMINARGRLSHAGEAVTLLQTGDADQALSLAELLHQANQERRTIEKATITEALNQVTDHDIGDDPMLVVAHPDWHPGVLGLVAGRLAKKFHRPAAVIGNGGKGSCRSVPGVNLVKVLNAGSEFLEKFGGHPAAAGLTCDIAELHSLRACFSDAVVAQRGAPPYPTTVAPAFEVALKDLSLAHVDHLNRLAPFGQGNPEPLWIAHNVTVQSHREVGVGHLKMKLDGVDGIGFGLHEALDGQVPECVDIVFRVSRNVFRGRESLQVEVEDLRAAATGAMSQAA